MNIFRFKTEKERPESLEHKDSPNYFWTIGMAISVLMMVLILVGYVWTPYSTTEMSGREKFLSPCLRHPLGRPHCLRPDGLLRFHVLAGKSDRSIEKVCRQRRVYLCADGCRW